MADRALVIAWGTPVRGLEERGLEVFNEALGILGRMQQDGRIESFDVCLFEPNTNVSGVIMIRGTTDQIDALRTDDEFRRNTADAALIVDGLRHTEGYVNEGVARQMELYQEAIAKIPQRV
ncbi:MAG TPA: hypothetical protein VMD09_07300 [Solirubrobacteraceae bacterium]|nr:hypothetical protein [Solirubrobacteraceae bacterium]